MSKPLLPVMKNGKFFGYADKDQIKANKKLSIFDPIVKQEKEPEPEPEKEPADEKKADPATVRRGPKKG